MEAIVIRCCKKCINKGSFYNTQEEEWFDYCKEMYSCNSPAYPKSTIANDNIIPKWCPLRGLIEEVQEPKESAAARRQEREG